MLVHGIVVEDHVDRLTLGCLALDGVEETDEFVVMTSLHVAADHLAVENIERGEKGRRAVAFVVMRPLRGCGDPAVRPSRQRFIGRPGCVRSKA
jgi:hypothetical protein